MKDHEPMLDDLKLFSEDPFYNAPAKKSIIGRNGLWINFSYDSVDPRFDNAIAWLMQQHEFPGHERKIKRNLKSILVNIHRLLRSNEPYLVYMRNHGHYTEICEDKHDNPLCITKTIVPIIDVLIDEGYLAGKVGFFALHWKSECSKIVPLDKMRCFIDSFDLLSAKIEKSGIALPIVVRNKDKEVTNHRSPTATRLGKRVIKINALLLKTNITLSDGTLAASQSSADDISLYRVFNNSTLDDGGRFYGGFWQRLPSEKRAHILINGEETEELSLYFF